MSGSWNPLAGVAARVVEDRDAEHPERELGQRVVAHRLAELDLGDDLAGRLPLGRRSPRRSGGRRRRCPRRSQLATRTISNRAPPFWLRIASRVSAVRSPSAASEATTAIRVEPPRSRSFAPIGSSATMRAIIVRMIVETWKIRDRTSSRYSRVATWLVFGKAGSSRSGRSRTGRVTPRPPPSPVAASRSSPRARQRRRSSASTGRPTWSMKICSSDGSAISKWRHPRARCHRRREDHLGLDAGVELDLRPVDPRPQDPRARHARQPAAAGGRRRPTAGRAAGRSTASPRGAARRRPSARGRRSRSTRTSPRPSPSGGSRRSASCRRRGARGAPRGAGRR